MKRAKRKRRSEPEMDAKTKAVIENAIRIRTRMRVRDLSGQPKMFRSTVAEDSCSAGTSEIRVSREVSAEDPESVEDEEETEGDSG